MHNKNKANKSKPREDVLSVDPDVEAKIDAMMEVAHSPNLPEPEKRKPLKIEQDDSSVTIPIRHDTTIPPSAPDLPAAGVAGIADELVTESEANPLSDGLEHEALVVPAQQAVPDASETDIPEESDDPALAAAVDDITKAESDTVLAAEDAQRAQANGEIEAKKPKRNKLAALFVAWWESPIARWLTFCACLVAIVAVAAIPNSRYYVLNTAGVRSAMSITVVDDTNNQPLPNVTVKLGALTTKTNETGKASFTSVPLGDQQLIVSRVAFAPASKTVTIGWGSNPLGDLPLKATGAQYVLHVTDYLSSKPILAKATSGDSVTQADKKGKVVVTLEDPKTDSVTIVVSAMGYKTKEITIPSDVTTVQEVAMTPTQPLVYVTKQQGTYDLYSVETDGANKKLLLKGTGSERPRMGLMTSQDGAYVAFVSSREKKYDSDNYLLDTLTLIDLSSGATTKIDQAQDIELVSWRDGRLIYRAAYAGPSAAMNDRQRLVSYNVSESARQVLATSNYFVGVYGIGDYLYYGANAPGTKGDGAFGRMRYDGTDKTVILSAPVWSVSRTKLDEMYVSANNEWYRYSLPNNTLTKQQQPQDNYQATAYVMSPDNSRAAYIDVRDGQSVLLVTDKNGKEKAIANAHAIYSPITWLNDSTITYYVDTGDETAVYVVNIDGGKAVKINPATLVMGAGAGYY